MSPYEMEDEESDRMRLAGKKISRAHRYGLYFAVVSFFLFFLKDDF